jgi:hypothetical protein
MKSVANQPGVVAAIDMLPAFCSLLTTNHRWFAEPHVAHHIATTVAVHLTPLPFRGTVRLSRWAAVAREADPAAAVRIALAYPVVFNTDIGSTCAAVADVRATLGIGFAACPGREL